MTELMTMAGEAEARRRRMRRLRGPLLAAIAVTVLAAAFVGGRSMLAARDRSKVHVVAKDDYFTCNGTEVVTDQTDPWEAPKLLARAVDGMNCEYRFTVENRGVRSIQLERLRFGIIGPGTGTSGTAVRLDPGGYLPRTTDPDDPFPDNPPIDAIFDVALDLPPGATQEFAVRIEFQPTGCTAPDSWTWTSQTPELTLRSRGVSGTRSNPTPAFGFLGTEQTDCSLAE